MPAGDTLVPATTMPSDDTAFAALSEKGNTVEGWRLAYWDIGEATSIDVNIEVPQSVAMVAG